MIAQVWLERGTWHSSLCPPSVIARTRGTDWKEQGKQRDAIHVLNILGNTHWSFWKVIFTYSFPPPQLTSDTKIKDRFGILHWQIECSQGNWRLAPAREGPSYPELIVLQYYYPVLTYQTSPGQCCNWKVPEIIYSQHTPSHGLKSKTLTTEWIESHLVYTLKVFTHML